MQLLKWKAIPPKKPTKSQLKRELRSLLRKDQGKQSASSRYAFLKAAKDFAETHGLEMELPETFRDDFRRACRDYLFAYVLHEHGVDLSVVVVSPEECRCQYPDCSHCSRSTRKDQPALETAGAVLKGSKR